MTTSKPQLLAYIDECGDRGWKPRPKDTPVGRRRGSSCTFAMTAVIVPDGAPQKLLKKWDDVRRGVRRESAPALHWNEIRDHGQRLYVAQQIGCMNEITLISVVICKWMLAAGHGLTDPTFLHNWTFRLMLERLSWYAENRDALMSMFFGQVKGLDYKRLTAYQAVLESMTTKISWNHLRLPITIDTPARRRMLQVADSASGAVHAAFERDEFGNIEWRYLDHLKGRFWRRGSRPLWKDGLKVAPLNDEVRAEYPLLEDYCA